jgi:hypothetical protein
LHWILESQLFWFLVLVSSVDCLWRILQSGILAFVGTGQTLQMLLPKLELR